MKLCIFGSRGFEFQSANNGPQFDKIMSLWVRVYGMPDQIISGHCKNSPDVWGEDWALANKVDLKIFEVTPEQWRKYGKTAGPMRNSDMAAYMDRSLGFWDGKSRGTGDMILKSIVAKGSIGFVDVIFPDTVPHNVFQLKRQLQ